VVRHLFIVSRQHPDLFCYLTREFAPEPEVQVILDRRRAERRVGVQEVAIAHDRRNGDRRVRPQLRGELSTLGYAFVRLF
jgi:hypothetical protein